MPAAYRVFIVRAWAEDTPDHPARFLLEIPRTGERVGFTDPERLLAALLAELTQAQGSGPNDPPVPAP